jgi:serine/threonine-protein kinase
MRGGKSEEVETRQEQTSLGSTTLQGATIGDTQDASLSPLFPMAEPGDMIGAYQVIRLLAAGGMGQVYLAQRDGSQFAVKTVTLGPGQDAAQVVDRFKREIAVGEAIQHVNVCRLLDAGVSGERHFLVMEYLQGETLADCIGREAPLATDATQGILHYVLRGLEAIHRLQVVHRDLKPANVMLVMDGSVKIMDLGISQAAMGPSLTRTGSSLGTPLFIAPEQVADAKRVDHRADLFCAGLIAYQMLSGHLPYDAPRLSLRMHRLTKGDQTSIAEHRPDLPVVWVEWLARMIRHERDERFGSAAEARSVLESLPV